MSTIYDGVWVINLRSFLAFVQQSIGIVGMGLERSDGVFASKISIRCGATLTVYARLVWDGVNVLLFDLFNVSCAPLYYLVW